MGIDPASEKDNFSIVILELHSDHTRIVYCWTTNKKNFRERIAKGLAGKADYFGFCARKIRDLMKAFPIEEIAIDAQGGGYAIAEALHDPDKMEEGEIAIWPTIDPDKKEETDILPGLHILHMCQFAKADWTRDANHGLRKDFEDKVLLFPRFDPVSLEIATAQDRQRELAWQKTHNKDDKFNIYDTLDDCVSEIEELKDELCTIVVSRTGSGVGGRDKWDTPEVKLPNGKKGRIRKDRYSALVMANMVARTMIRALPAMDYSFVGGFTHDLAKGQQPRGQLYKGPEWFTSGAGNVGFGVVRK
jgi:hypothetical protein